jgi:HPt (histidine-containing phosphotransfer) domain-containing protein
MEELQSMIQNWGEIIKNGNALYPKSEVPLAVESAVSESELHFIKDIQSESDASFFGELLEVYMSELPKMIQQINSANESGDHKTVYFYSHKLKGSSMTLGINSIARACEELECLAKDQQINTRTNELTVELVKIFEQVIKDLEVIKEKYTKFLS